jgi:hypothetical protein
MNGVTKNIKRQFSTIGIESVESMLRTLFESKQYGIKFYRNRVLENGQQTGNLVVVDWTPSVESGESQNTSVVPTSTENVVDQPHSTNPQ